MFGRGGVTRRPGVPRWRVWCPRVSAFGALSSRLHIVTPAALGAAAFLAVGISALQHSDGDARPNVAVAVGTGSHLAIPGLAFDGTPEPTPTPLPEPTPGPGPLPAGPAGLRLWSDGDSTSYFMTDALFREWESRAGIPVRAADYKISSGLWRDDFFDWPAYIASEMAAYDPDVAVFMVGANDANQVSSHQEYAARVGRVMDLMHREGRVVVWLGQPCMGNASLAASIPAVNRIFQEQAALRPWVVYVDTWSLTSSSDGSCPRYLPGESGALQEMRTSDGIHFTGAGGRRLALAVLAALFPAE